MQHRVRRYVVGLDRELGMAALDHALAMAAPEEAEVHAIFVYQPLGDATNLYGGPADPAMEYELERLAPLVHERVARFGPDAPVILLHGVVGPAAASLVACAAVLDADLIVVGTHGRTGIPRAVLGSVAERVVRTAGCPVTVVRERLHEMDVRWPTHHKQVDVR
jgi:nucleotide-binding universal stress UspA family protein